MECRRIVTRTCDQIRRATRLLPWASCLVKKSKDDFGASNTPQGMIKIAEFLGKKGWALRYTSGCDVRDPEGNPFLACG